MLDYAVLRIIWWVLLGVLLSGFAIMDGFDLGVAALLPFVGKTDMQRRVVINTVGPVWEGNQVWIILGAGAIFAAWPVVYALSFSGFYMAILLLLLTFILRPVAFKFRSKVEHAAWRSTWDWTLCLCGITAALLFGIAVGNVLQGVPFHFSHMLRLFYTGSFWALLNPFAILCGLVSISMLLMHGGLYLTLKTENEIQNRSLTYSRIFSVITIILFAVGGWWVSTLNGFQLAQPVTIDGPSNPLYKHVIMQTGALLFNYEEYPWMLIAPILGFCGALFALGFGFLRFIRLAFIGSSLSIFGIITTVGLSMFPFIIPSSSNPSQSLIVWDSSSSKTTLEIMLVATAIFLPIILAYTSWVFWVLRGKVSEKDVEDNHQSY